MDEWMILEHLPHPRTGLPPAVLSFIPHEATFLPRIPSPRFAVIVSSSCVTSLIARPSDPRPGAVTLDSKVAVGEQLPPGFRASIDSMVAAGIPRRDPVTGIGGPLSALTIPPATPEGPTPRLCLASG